MLSALFFADDMVFLFKSIFVRVPVYSIIWNNIINAPDTWLT